MKSNSKEARDEETSEGREREGRDKEGMKMKMPSIGIVGLEEGV